MTLESTNSNNSSASADKSLQAALSALDITLCGRTSLFTLQVLLTIVLGIQRLRPGDSVARNILGVASRTVLSLALHRSNDIAGLSFSERLEKLQAFWCFYILDVETSMRENIPPCIHYDDVDMLLVEPPKLSHRGYGLVQSLDGNTLNLYTARQRLARIGGLVWKELHTSKGRYHPTAVRKEAVGRLNAKLVEWKAEWYDYGPSADLPYDWPEDSIMYIADVQFSFFQTMLMANVSITTSIAEMCDQVQNGQGLSLAPHCLKAARDTCLVAMAVQDGEATYIW
ncbi:uncharacterized protein LTR77_002806 [Saxophila tyrrhenica]|uniref:Xylanolytic transcriptional activator regulatory domain-containing protein n=1 Tax=Saxophila tyrrhenica TaxID=1690608 RepID=A0AAV9PFP0_9PEZI|nr:hypothetical protein LTR77_002806 [Saxophila tyrrhenica]